MHSALTYFGIFTNSQPKLYNNILFYCNSICLYQGLPDVCMKSMNIFIKFLDSKRWFSVFGSKIKKKPHRTFQNWQLSFLSFCKRHLFELRFISKVRRNQLVPLVFPFCTLHLNITIILIMLLKIYLTDKFSEWSQ